MRLSNHCKSFNELRFFNKGMKKLIFCGPQVVVCRIMVTPKWVNIFYQIRYLSLLNIFYVRKVQTTHADRNLRKILNIVDVYFKYIRLRKSFWSFKTDSCCLNITVIVMLQACLGLQYPWKCLETVRFIFCHFLLVNSLKVPCGYNTRIPSRTDVVVLCSMLTMFLLLW